MADYRGLIICDMTAGLGTPLGGKSRAFAQPETEANGAFIVRACNSHAALVEALEKAQKLIQAAWLQSLRKEVQDHMPFGYADELAAAELKDSIGLRAALKAANGVQL